MKKSLLAVIVLVALVASGCAPRDDGILRQIPPGTTVYIDGWDEHGDKGDQALVEQKPSKLWVVPMDAPYRNKRSGDFTVEITLNNEGVFVVEDLGGIQVGQDHDNCLASGEVYVLMEVPKNKLTEEPAKSNPDTSNDDCARVPE
ncbi:hypothetical protein [Salinactinospora qingdaonensis]|uniref:Lipoprotein n=1 Tax=Salinactinospora qingdaonensis TaxID=702744 RepID=A0ABP7FZ58_9ACTN